MAVRVVLRHAPVTSTHRMRGRIYHYVDGRTRSFQAADLPEPYWRVQLVTAAEAQRGPQSPNRPLRIGIKAALPVARPVFGRALPGIPDALSRAQLKRPCSFKQKWQ
jgi:hypothetical protein